MDEERLQAYVRMLKGIAVLEDLPLEIDLTGLLSLPGALRDPSQDQDLRERLWPLVQQATEQAVAEMVTMMMETMMKLE